MIKKENKNINIFNVIFAIVLTSPLLVAPISKLNLPIKTNFFILILEIGLVLGAFFFERPEKIKVMTFILLFMILFIYLLTMYTGIKTNYTFSLLLYYALIPVFVSGQKLDGECILRYILYISMTSIFALESLLSYQYEQLNQISMGSSYAIVTVIIASILHFRFFRKNANSLIKLCYLYNFYLFIRIIFLANRGAILSILMPFIMMIFCNYKDDNLIFNRWNLKRIIKISVFVLVAFFTIYNFEYLVNLMYLYSEKHLSDIPSFIYKMKLFIDENKLVNGRDNIYIILLPYILNSPIWGYGLQTFKYYTGYVWPHNFILQFLFEGGILFAAIPIYLSIKGIYMIVFQKINRLEQFVLIAMLMSLVFPRYIISNDPWKGPEVWLLIGTLANIKLKNRLKVESEKNEN